MTERNIGLEILEGIKEIKAYKQGQVSLKIRELKEPLPSLTLRQKLDLSQTAFANLIGVSLRTVQDWEQGRRKPSGPAKVLLCLVEQHPQIFATN